MSIKLLFAENGIDFARREVRVAIPGLESGEKLTDDQKTGILGQVPAGRMGNADEIGAAVLYLASPEAAYVTGTTLHVNGGMAMY